MKLSRDGYEFLLIPERAKIVADIFSKSVNGYGIAMIARELNARGITPWGKGKNQGKSWGEGYIIKILSNIATTGKFEMNMTPKRERSPNTPDDIRIIDNYYPAIERAYRNLEAEIGGKWRTD